MAKALNRIKSQLAQLDRENKWEDLQRDEVIDLLIFEEIKAASHELDFEGVGRMVDYLLKEGEKLKED
ncbi:hypothetical protein [Halalkalibacter akibai]|uniref:Uncharacterized protein n=1 Tax=Halalkalibacter akibai (strain ATCC 43226 / DSM 21942 / CIP 109018 / JCM 9157 / 1139) TaxID=1236973 RepID=W4QWN8_HALA3|nr:hypothetical protein [Halalkalibacter akibai]GAE36540.1 hypothetical protein JCM9157_3735 [Halalkalibacter akibai JCM 9157]